MMNAAILILNVVNFVLLFILLREKKESLK
jgi:hypothetical protein